MSKCDRCKKESEDWMGYIAGDGWEYCLKCFGIVTKELNKRSKKWKK